jgi:hypothetical protein
MPLSFSETQAIQKLAVHLYDFLPGNPHPFANPAVSFKGVADSKDLSNFWPGGSKKPAITQLLELTFDRQRDKFCSLISEIVRVAMKYKPLYREQVEQLNALLFAVKFKIPELWDAKFLHSLPLNQPKATVVITPSITDALRKTLYKKLLDLTPLDPQKRGYAFEKFLQELFTAFQLNPRSPFKILGEQIDGSLELDKETYLIEAKWQNAPVDQKELFAFAGKISGKATWSRGVFISYSGFSPDSISAYSKGHPANFITLNGLDLYIVLAGENGHFMGLDTCLRKKIRHAAETGNIVLSASDILRGV